MQIDECLIQVLAQMEQPAFLTKDGIIVYANPQAISFHFREAANVFEVCSISPSIYNAPWTEPIELPVQAGGLYFQAKLSHIGEFILFTLEHSTAKGELKALHLAAIKMKRPLFDLMNSVFDACEGSGTMEQIHKNAIIKHIYRLNRIVLNMDCANTYRFKKHHPQRTEMRSFLNDLIGSVEEKLNRSDVHLISRPLTQTTFCDLDQAMFTNAFLNMITNALDAEATQITVEVKRSGESLLISVSDNGKLILQELRMNMFNKFLREPAIHDSFLGLGLGMVIIHATANAHKGALLMDACNGDETRMTITLPLASQETVLHQKISTLFVDKTGGLDPVSVHLSGYLSDDQFNM